VGRWEGAWERLDPLISGALQYPLQETLRVSGCGFIVSHMMTL